MYIVIFYILPSSLYIQLDNSSFTSYSSLDLNRPSFTCMNVFIFKPYLFVFFRSFFLGSGESRELEMEVSMGAWEGGPLERYLCALWRTVFSLEGGSAVD